MFFALFFGFVKCVQLGTCGNGITYENDLNNPSRLSFSGTGILSCNFANEISINSLSEYTFYVIEEGITEIDDFTFYQCNTIQTLNFPNGFHRIGKYACAQCSSLSQTYGGVGIVDDYAFYGCTQLRTWVDVLVSFGEWSFSGTETTGGITIPSCINHIPSYAFYNCEQMTQVDIDQSINSIGTCAFANCVNLHSIYFHTDSIPDNLRYIGDYCFYRCISLTSIPSMPDGICSLGNGCFSGCTNIDQGFPLPPCLQNISSHLFYDCSHLTSLTIYSDISSIGISAFGGCSALVSISFLGSISNIGYNAFYGCTSLNTFNYAGSIVPYVNYNAFENCNLQTVSVTSYYPSLQFGRFSVDGGSGNDDGNSDNGNSNDLNSVLGTIGNALSGLSGSQIMNMQEETQNGVSAINTLVIVLIVLLVLLLLSNIVFSIIFIIKFNKNGSAQAPNI